MYESKRDPAYRSALVATNEDLKKISQQIADLQAQLERIEAAAEALKLLVSEAEPVTAPAEPQITLKATEFPAPAEPHPAPEPVAVPEARLTKEARVHEFFKRGGAPGNSLQQHIDQAIGVAATA